MEDELYKELGYTLKLIEQEEFYKNFKTSYKHLTKDLLDDSILIEYLYYSLSGQDTTTVGYNAIVVNAPLDFNIKTKKHFTSYTNIWISHHGYIVPVSEKYEHNKGFLEVLDYLLKYKDTNSDYTQEHPWYLLDIESTDVIKGKSLDDLLKTLVSLMWSIMLDMPTRPTNALVIQGTDSNLTYFQQGSPDFKAIDIILYNLYNKIYGGIDIDKFKENFLTMSFDPTSQEHYNILLSVLNQTYIDFSNRVILQHKTDDKSIVVLPTGHLVHNIPNDSLTNDKSKYYNLLEILVLLSTSELSDTKFKWDIKGTKGIGLSGCVKLLYNNKDTIDESSIAGIMYNSDLKKGILDIDTTISVVIK